MNLSGNYSVLLTNNFKREVKRLTKKYPSLKEETIALKETLSKEPQTGTRIAKNVYKIRLAIKSKGKRKRGGARVITYIVIAETIVYMLSIYDKSEKDDIAGKELKELLTEIPE